MNKNLPQNWFLTDNETKITYPPFFNNDFIDFMNSLDDRIKDVEYVCNMCIDFIVSKGYTLSDVIEYNKQ